MSPAVLSERPRLSTQLSQEIVATTIELMEANRQVVGYEAALNRKWNLELRLETLRQQEEILNRFTPLGPM